MKKWYDIRTNFKQQIQIIHKMKKSCCTVLIGIIFVTILSNPVYAEQGKESASISENQIKEFVDSYFTDHMEQFQTPGAAVAVVKGEKELFRNAYGKADLETELSVDACSTTFPACSVSKLFTATAIMQLQEQEKIDLNEDITTYLDDVTIKNTFAQPITVAELLTHTSGLDEQSELNGSTLDQQKIETQHSYFENHIPIVIHKPGTVSCYSNMGYNLLGYLVEKVSGQSYEEYVQEHILNALDMKSSSVRIGDRNRAAGYQNNGFGNEEQEFAYQYTSGSSGIISTVQDMEHFMSMYLNQGSFQNRIILQDKTVQMMEQKQFANASVYEGMGYGWIRENYNNHLILKHEGALPGYTTTLFLIPEENLGFYVATNSTTGICFDFEDALLQYLYGEQNNADTEHIDTQQNETSLKSYIGMYRSYDGIGRKNMMKLGVLMDDTDLTVCAAGDGKLKAVLYNQKKEQEVTLLSPCGNGVFLREDGKGYITFRNDDNSGKAEYAFTEVSHCTYEKIGLLESKPLLLVGWCAIPILIIYGIVLLVQLFRKKWKGTSFVKYAALTIVGQGTVIITFVAGVILEMQMIMSYQYHNIGLLKFILTLLVISVIVMLGATGYGIYLGCRGKISRNKMMLISIFGVIQMILIAELLYFNMLGIHVY